MGRHDFRLLFQTPRISALRELVDDVIGDRVPLLLSQPRLGPTDDLARSHERESNGVSEHLSSGHSPCEHTENGNASR